MSDVIYKKIEPHDLNPEKRSWYYDDFGNRRDKITDAPVVIVNDDSNDKVAELLNEYYLKGPSYDTK